MWFQITHLPQKGTCFGSMSNIILPNYCPHHSTAFRKNPYTRLYSFGSNWIQIAHFSQELLGKLYGKILYYFCVLIVFYRTTTFQKKISESKSSDKVA